MKRKILPFLLLLILVSGSLSACASSQETEIATTEVTAADIPDTDVTNAETALTDTTDVTPRQGQTLDLTIAAPSLANNMLGEEPENNIAIYLPPDYETSGKHYSVLYYLPGYGDSYSSFIKLLSTSMDKSIEAGNENTFIIVSINGINKLGGSFYYNSPVTGNWEDFVTKDVIEYIDSNYRTIASPVGRGLVGHSMGGFGVINIAMHTTGLYGYAYSMSPGVMDEEGMSNLPVYFSTIASTAELYQEMNEDEAREAYLDLAKTLAWPNNFTFSFGAAFAPDPEGKAPYIKLPETEDPEDENWMLFYSGYGNMEEKIDTYRDNLRALKGFVIEYGVFDDFRFIREGCNYFSALLNEYCIPHELVSFFGAHQDKIHDRMPEAVIPYFVRNLAQPQ